MGQQIPRWFIPAAWIGRKYAEAAARKNGVDVGATCWWIEGMPPVPKALPDEADAKSVLMPSSWGHLWKAMDEAVRAAVVEGSLPVFQSANGPRLPRSAESFGTGVLYLHDFCQWAQTNMRDCPADPMELAQVLGLSTEAKGSIDDEVVAWVKQRYWQPWLEEKSAAEKQEVIVAAIRTKYPNLSHRQAESFARIARPGEAAGKSVGGKMLRDVVSSQR